MSNNYSENSQHEIQPDREYHPNSDAVAAKLAIEELAEETHELSDEQSKAIAGGQSKLEKPSFDLLESIQGVLSKLGPRNLSH